MITNAPCIDQTSEQIGAYYKNAAVGDVAAVRQTQGHTLKYTITIIEGKNHTIGMVYVAFYTKHGKNCYHPMGQTTLVVPTESVKQWAATYPHEVSTLFAGFRFK